MIEVGSLYNGGGGGSLWEQFTDGAANGLQPLAGNDGIRFTQATSDVEVQSKLYASTDTDGVFLKVLNKVSDFVKGFFFTGGFDGLEVTLSKNSVPNFFVRSRYTPYKIEDSINDNGTDEINTTLNAEKFAFLYNGSQLFAFHKDGNLQITKTVAGAAGTPANIRVPVYDAGNTLIGYIDLTNP